MYVYTSIYVNKIDLSNNYQTLHRIQVIQTFIFAQHIGNINLNNYFILLVNLFVPTKCHLKAIVVESTISYVATLTNSRSFYILNYED